MGKVRYEIHNISKARHQAMVHFKHFLELMENGTIEEGDPFDVSIEFISSDGSMDREHCQNYNVPPGIIPLFTSSDIGDYGGFHMLHGVSRHGAPWDSEGQSNG